MSSAMSESFSPLVLTCGSLILTLNNRNMNLSERIRKSCEGIIQSDVSELRKDNLKEQIALFLPRYEKNQHAIILLFVAFFSFVIMKVFADGTTPTAGICALGAMWFGIGLMVFGFGGMCQAF